MLNLAVGLVPQATEEDYALTVGPIWRLTAVLDDQGASRGRRLEANVGMVEVSPGGASWNLQLVVKEVLWWNRPLGGERRPVRKGGCRLSETMPVLCCWVRLILA